MNDCALPSDERRRGGQVKYPVTQLEVGEKVFFPGANVVRVGNAVRHNKPMKFECTTIMVRGIVGVRVRRIA